LNGRNRAVYFLQEIAIVVVGVLIAVSINNYKESIDNENYIEKALLAIENEIKQSQSEVDTVLNKHIRLYEALQNEIGENEQTLGEMIASLGGVQVASIKNISLRFFIANKAELMDFKLISQLLEIETQTNVLSDKFNRLANYAYAHINDRKDEA